MRPYSSGVLSFIVPAFNEEVELPATIAAIRDAVQDRQYEIIVVDDASSDATAHVAREAGAQVVAINRRQIAAARNAGARVARGDVLLFGDADTRIRHEHVAGALESLRGGYDGGSLPGIVDRTISPWGRAFVTKYFAVV